VEITTFRRVALLGVVALALIVVTGGAVRLTGSGLGCPTWPSCTDTSLVPTAEYAEHGLIEFGNRLVSVALGLLMLVIPVLAFRLRERRRDLVLLSLGLWAGFLGQVVLGGLTVLFDLAPPFVMAHFLLSMLLLVDAVALHHRAGGPAGSGRAAVRREVVWLARLLAAAAGVTLVLGTVVTGAGPHSGGSVSADRLPLDLETVARVHADAAMLLVGLVLATVFALRATDAPAAARRWGTVLLAVVVAQATVGFTQYLLDVPAGLVGLHIALATLLWIAAVKVGLELVVREPAGPAGPVVAGPVPTTRQPVRT
jgi:cytochrome c oxidase assembly protein subunit 15